MDSKGSNFTIAETHALLEGVKGHYASIVWSSGAGGMVTNKRNKDIWVEITQNVNENGVWPEEDLGASEILMEESKGQSNKGPCWGKKHPNRQQTL